MNADRAQFKFYVDTPRSGNEIMPFLIVRGWCFGLGGRSIKGIRLKANGLTFQGIVGLPRADVRAAYPKAPSDDTGFEIRAVIPPGPASLVIEALAEDGGWHPLTTIPARIKRKWLPRWLRVGTAAELLAFQMPAHKIHAPRPISRSFRPSYRHHPRLRLSIVTPSFNQGRFLAETIESVLSQTGADCDYVAQDGGSSDRSVELITQHSNLLHAWESARDSGQADAIARGFTKTSGSPADVMAWINSDDFYLPGSFAFVLHYFERHPEVDVIYGHRLLVNESSQEIARWFLPKHDPEVLQLNDFVPQETMFWRRRIWDKIGGIDTSFKFAMDWDLLLRFQGSGAKIVRVPYFLACFRIHSLQKTSGQMHSIGQAEIDLLRERTFGRKIHPSELEKSRPLLRYLRMSAFIEFCWRRLGIRCP